MDDGAAVATLAGEGHHTLCLAWQRQGAQVSADLCVAGHLGVPSCVLMREKQMYVNTYAGLKPLPS